MGRSGHEGGEATAVEGQSAPPHHADGGLAAGSNAHFLEFLEAHEKGLLVGRLFLIVSE